MQQSYPSTEVTYLPNSAYFSNKLEYKFELTSKASSGASLQTMVSKEPDGPMAWYWQHFNFIDSPGDSLKDGKCASYWLWWMGIGIAYITYYLTMVVAKPKVICSGKALKEIIAEHCPIFYECYWPVVWAFNSHFMTVIRSRIQYNPKIEYQRYLQMNVVHVCDVTL